MSAALILGVAGLAAAGTFLITARSLSRIVIGFAAHRPRDRAGVDRCRWPRRRCADRRRHRPAASPTRCPRRWRSPPSSSSFGLTLFVLALARRQQQLTGNDLVEDDIEDRRIAAIHGRMHDDGVEHEHGEYVDEREWTMPDDEATDDSAGEEPQR